MIGQSISIRRTDAGHKEGICPLVQIVASLRILAYGNSSYEVYEIFELSRACARQSFMCSIDEVIDIFESTYLRAPTEKYYRRIFAINCQHGFSVCVESWN